MKAVFEYNGIPEGKCVSPTVIFKLAYSSGMIENENGWLDLLDTRNILTHTYRSEDAFAAIDKIKNEYLPLFDRLKAVIDEEWEIGE